MTEDRRAEKKDALNHLSGLIAHELNGALTVILGSLEILNGAIEKWEQAPPPVRLALDHITRTAHRTALLAERLQAAAGQQFIDPRPFVVDHILYDLISVWRKTSRADVHIEACLSPTLGTIAADATQLTAALNNLLQNADDAMPQGGKVTITCSNITVAEGENTSIIAGEYVRIAVGDVGAGMNADILQRATELSFTTKGDARKLGLGLSQVENFVNRSDGYMTIDSTPGKGTCVTLYFPHYISDVPNISEACAPSARKSARASILLVDDDDDVREHIAETLERLHYDVTPVRNAEEALQRLAAICFDLLLTDIRLPGAHGHELAQKALSAYPNIRVLFMSGNAHGRHSDSNLFERIECLKKPMTKAILHASVERVLGR